eukprot:1789499-Prymnesium_polylepis.1
MRGPPGAPDLVKRDCCGFDHRRRAEEHAEPRTPTPTATVVSRRHAARTPRGSRNLKLSRRRSAWPMTLSMAYE